MKCSVDACDKPRHAKTWCTTHYSRWYRLGDVLAAANLKNKGFRCYAKECEKEAVAKRLCQKHHQRLMINGDPEIVRKGGENDTRWKGGRHVNGQGYIEAWVDKKDPLYSMTKTGKPYALEHRLVMARSLGRPLTRKETVHHINGDRKDNRLENLQLRSGSHGPGVVMQCTNCGSHDIKSVKL